MKPRSLAVAAVLLVFTSTLAPLAQRQSAPAPPAPRAADTMVPGAPASIGLDLPASVFSAHAAFRQVLEAAGVRYGLEGPAWDPAKPPIDFARTRENTEPLAGRRLGEALNAIVKVAPQFRWAEIDGVIVVRSTPPGQSILDLQIPRFTVTNAPPRPALDAVIAVLDPARPRGAGTLGFGRPGSGAAGGPEKIGRNVTLTLTNTTIQTILTAIARSNGEMSWTVQYDRAPASIETATITLNERGETVTAQSPLTLKEQISSSPSGQRVTIAVSMVSMLSNYVLRSNLKLSIEEVAGAPGILGLVSGTTIPTAGLPPLELPDAPSQAVARIVALDSRYEWSEQGGRFRVRPRTGVAGRIDLLDKSVDGFVATNEPARAVIERAGRTVGTTRPFGMASPASGRGPSSIDTAMATPISVNLTGTVTPRDIFDAIADATGWRWSLRPTFTPGQPSMLSLQWRSQTAGRGTPGVGGALISSNGSVIVSAGGGPIPNWSTTLNITAPVDLSPAPMPMRPPSGAIPALLDREIAQVTLTFDPGPGPFQQFALAARLPLTVEELPPPPAPQDPRRMTRPKPPIVVGPGKFSDAVYVLLEKLPDYEADSTDGMVNVVPSALVQSREYFMNRPVTEFSVNNVGLFRAVGELRRSLDPRFEPRDWESGGGEILNRPVTLSARNASPRVILNRLVRQHGDLTWASSFAARNGVERRAPGVEDWIITLTTISAPGPIVSLTASGGVPASSLLPRITRSNAVGVRAINLDLPVTSLSLRIALGGVGRVTGIPIGLETIAGTTPTLGERATEYYDLTGLTGSELMDKLQALAPDYEFTLTNDVHRVRPRTPQSESTPWLDQRIDRFEQQFENLRDAQAAIAAIGRPGIGGRGMPPGAQGRGAAPLPAPASGNSTLNERLKKTLVISLTNVTVREILDEIARQFGQMMWTVDQRTSPQVTTTMSLTFSGFDGWSTGTSIR